MRERRERGDNDRAGKNSGARPSHFCLHWDQFARLKSDIEDGMEREWRGEKEKHQRVHSYFIST